ncbi:MAG TPA: hypothetical protein VMU29_05315 [Smithella sp.]|nr:hypothetical protein [Smithella sp.]
MEEEKEGEVSNEETHMDKENDKNDQPKLCEFDVDEIVHFEPTTDHITCSLIPCPYIIVTPMSKLCIDGFNFIEDAKEKGNNKIAVLAEFWDQHSDYKIALKKFNLRYSANKEPIYYIEMMKHIANLKKIKLNENSKLIQFGVGGARKNIESSSKLNTTLAADTKLSLETIGKYLSDIKYVNDHVINTLTEYQRQPAEEDYPFPNKDFFEIIRPKKNRAIIDYESEDSDYDSIQKKISDAVLDAYEKYRHNLPIEEFSNKQQEEIKSITSAINDIKENILNIKEPVITSPPPVLPILEEPGKETLTLAVNSSEEKIQNLAVELWKLAAENEDILEKKNRFSEILNELLLIVGSI